ncbi:putative transcriptional regulator [Mesoplasma florum L1]|uniref:Transcriptional regulator n=1 Tax=Mesoplasma florum (strain ATCC 33453 / NBRC 100688 / NCTC 11704 / L1) TaxID=265311 RepID=Q6F2A7_MESFL|nr:transcriptional regulator [Mesoplasma florum]AAT75366.1 putative transcriptional regulator [Mesoplasma florum L1]ATI73657.1 hypothetical protein CQZ70_00055 [Mesoplasma florum]
MKEKMAFRFLEEIAEQDFNLTNKLIAETLLENAMKGHFLAQKDVCDKCFVSASTITKFSKTLGYEGFRELIFSLKNEYDVIAQKKKTIDKINIFESIESWIINSKNFIENLGKNIINSKRINIYYSYCLKSSAESLYETILGINKDVFLINHNQISIINHQLRTGDINIFLVSGKDNQTLLKYYQYILANQKSSNFVIASKLSNWVEKNNDFAITFDIGDDFSLSLYRNIALQCLTLELLKLIV